MNEVVKMEIKFFERKNKILKLKTDVAVARLDIFFETDYMWNEILKFDSMSLIARLFVFICISLFQNSSLTSILTS